MGQPRHDFVIAIPVADRPRQLADCLDSLAGLLQRFPYAGAVSVLIADDSLDAAAIERHGALARAHTRAGLPTLHLDRAAQQSLIDDLPGALRLRLAGVLGRAGAGSAERLGASVMRNLACLWASRQPQRGRRLIWFVDSDEHFRVEVETATGEAQAHDLDYLHTLDRLFSERPIEVLSGKVVGDPPVSPAVMAGTLLDDALAFLSELIVLDPHAPCRFHGQAAPLADAAYHDMADLFGYPAAAAVRYRCPLAGEHDHAACLARFAADLEQFFDGVHPTRRSRYEPAAPLTLTPARTVYTGNYVLGESALGWFIPYADLGLRMAGPSLGRLLKAELGERFVAANLPLWHGRTLADLGRSECRPGVEHSAQGVNLAGEFERQYYGDVLLFSLQALIEQGYPRTTSAAAIRQTVEAVEARLNARYAAQQAAVAERIARLDAQLAAMSDHWRHEPMAAAAREALERFVRALRHNFGQEGSGWRRIDAPGQRQAWVERLAAALVRLPDARAAWREALERV